MTTEKQIAANRSNALKSTGPRTPEGKAVSRLNALKHGVYSKELIIDRDFVREDPEEFRQLVESMVSDLKPEGTMETVLVQKIAISFWRLRRIYLAEAGHFRTELREEKTGYQYPSEPDTEWLDPNEIIENEDIQDLVQTSRQADLPTEELVQLPAYAEFLEEKHPGKRESDLSEHQLKRLRTAFRKSLKDRAMDVAMIITYQDKAIPKQRALLVPDDNMGKQETRLERSIQRDLATLEKLQKRRKAAE